MQIVKSLFLVVTLLVSFTAISEIEIKGAAELIHTGFGQPSAKDRESLKDKAVNAALSRWASQQGSSFLKNYDQIREQVEKNLGDYVIQTSVLTESYDKESKRLNIVVRVTLDDIRLKNLVTDSSAVANTSANEKSLLTFIFVARRQDSVQSFDAKTFSRVDASVSEQGSEAEASSGNSAEYQSNTTKSEELTTGGSQTAKSEKIEYRVSSASEINIAMNEVFGNAGFEVVDAEFVEEETNGLLSIEKFRSDFGSGNDVSGATLRNAAKGAKMVELPYLAQGTLDVGLPTDDSATGLKRVSVTVTGKLINLQGRFPTNVASVGPVQFAGLGPTVTEAERNALKLAAESAAQELVNQLNSKSVR